MARLKNEEIVTIVKQEIARAEGWDSDKVDQERAQALDYYFTRPRGDEQNGRSAVQSADVHDALESIMAQIIPLFISDTQVVFEPNSEEDEEQAKIESEFVADIFLHANDGYVNLMESAKDALLLENGLMKVWIDEDVSRETLQYVGMDQETINFILADADAQTEKTLTSWDEKTGEASISVTTTIRTLKVQSVDIVNFMWAAEHESIYLEGVRFCAERELVSRTELISRGYSKSAVKDLAASSQNNTTGELARSRSANNDRQAVQSAMDNIEVFDCYIMLDDNENGEADLQRVVIAGTTILKREPAKFIPYAAGTAFLYPHRFRGISIFEKLKQVQDVKTAVLRQWLDNLRTNNNNKTGVVEGQVNMDDMEEGRPDGFIRIRNPNALVPLPILDTGPSALAALQYQDKVRTERVGASIEMQANESQIAGWMSEGGIERQYSSREQMAGMINTTLAETLIRSIYLLIHRTMREFLPGELTARMKGQWQTTEPSQWQPRDRATVKVGMTPGERSKRQQALQGLIQLQMQGLQSGMAGILVDLPGLHRSITDMLTAAGIKSPEDYLVDPSSPAAQQVAQQQQQQTQQQQQAAQQAQQQQTQQAIELERYKIDKPQEFKYFDSVLKAETEEAKIVGEATLDLAKQQEEGRQRSEQDNNSDGGTA